MNTYNGWGEVYATKTRSSGCQTPQISDVYVEESEVQEFGRADDDGMRSLFFGDYL